MLVQVSKLISQSVSKRALPNGSGGGPRAGASPDVERRGKLRILPEADAAKVDLASVARPRDLCPQQVYAWRHELKKKGLLSPTAEAIFLPIEMIGRPERVGASAPAAAAPAAPTPIELRLANGRCLRFDATVDRDLVS